MTAPPPQYSQPPHRHRPIDYQTVPVDESVSTEAPIASAYNDASTLLFLVFGSVVIVLAIVAASLALCQR